MQNRFVLNVPDELPESLEAATQHFSEFLQVNGYPHDVRWIAADDVAVNEQARFLIRDREESSIREAQVLYKAGLRRELGIALRAVCATDKITFALIFVPRDETDAEYALMPKGLKLSCPTRRYDATLVNNSLLWLLLRLRNRKRTKSRMELFQ